MGALLARSGADHLIDIGVVVEVAHQLRDALVRVGHVGVGPDDDLAACIAGANAADGARTTVAPEGDNAQLRVGLLDAAQPREGLIGRLVIDRQQLVGVAAGVERDTDPGDLLEHVVLLVVTGQDDGHIRTRRDDVS